MVMDSLVYLYMALDTRDERWKPPSMVSIAVRGARLMLDYRNMLQCANKFISCRDTALYNIPLPSFYS